MIEHAVEPLREQTSAEQFERLDSALAAAIGWEAMIVLRDTRNLPRPAEQRVTRWSAHAPIDTMLTEAANSTPEARHPSAATSLTSRD